MNCPQCETVVELQQDGHFNMFAHCPRCLYHEPLSSFVEARGKGKYVLKYSGYDGYEVLCEKNLLGVVKFREVNLKRAIVSFKAEQPSKALEFFTLLTQIFGEKLKFLVEQTGVDPEFHGCPLCHNQNLTWNHQRSWSAICGDHFEVEMLYLIQSFTVRCGLVVIPDNDYHFLINLKHKGFNWPWQPEKFTEIRMAEAKIRHAPDRSVVVVKFLAEEKFRLVFELYLEALQEKMKYEHLEIMEIH